MRKIELKNWRFFYEGKAFPANVPGDITDDLYRNGLIPDPIYGENLRALGWIFERDWTYECEFFVDRASLSEKRLRLCFEGVDTVAQIVLNGTPLGTTENMFLQYTFDVKELLQERNVLTVTVSAPQKEVRERSRDGYTSLFHYDRLFLRKAQCHFGWDWAPPLPGIGLWLPVYLTVDGGATIAHAKITADTDGNVSVLTLLDAADIAQSPGKYELELTVDGKTCVLSVKRDYTLLNIKVDNPKLWWPNGYGEQNLYDYRLTLKQNGQVCDEKVGRLGFREIKRIEKPLSDDGLSFGFTVNGKKIFCKGSNWVPIRTMTGAIEGRDYDRFLKIAQEANYNMLRVWGGGIYEKDRFYELCDELGIMVWQDFGFACSSIPEDIDSLRESFLQEAEYQIKRLRNHPSLVVLCGGNEGYIEGKNGRLLGERLLKYTLRGMCEELVGNVIYLHNSPYGIPFGEWERETGDAHIACQDIALAENRLREYRKIIAERPARFVSECIVLGPTRIRSLRKFIPENELWPTTDCWEYHFVKNPYAIDPKETFLAKEKKMAEGFFGDISTLQNFVKKAMIAQAEIMESELEYNRVNGDSNGFMNWMYNDAWGCGTWSVVDIWFEKKPAYYTQKRAFSPLHVCYSLQSEGLCLAVINDETTAAQGKLRFGVRTLKGETVEAQERQISVPAGGCIRIAAPWSTCEREEYLFAEFTAEDGRKRKDVYFPELWAEKTWETDLDVSVTAVENGEYQAEILLRANVFARTVFLDYPDNLDLVYSDNYFDMEKGEEKRITVTSPRPLKASAFTVKTFADDWE